jgi:parvulin-like peptidyl-prolyl isomerase
MRASFRRAAGAALLLGLSAAPALAASDPVIANLGAQAIKASDLADFVDRLNPQQRQQAAKDPKIMLQLVRSVIGRRVIVEEAEKQAWDKKPEIAAEIERARRQVILGSYLRSVALPPGSYPDDREISDAYDANKERFLQYHLAQIFLAEPPNATREQVNAIQRKAHDLAKKAKARGADFAALARSASQDQATAKKGGDLGWLAQNQILPEVLGAVMATGEKGVTDPILAAGGWHIIAVMGVKPAELSQVHDQIASILRERKFVQNQQAYIEKLLDEKHLTVNETAAAAMFAAKK